VSRPTPVEMMGDQLVISVYDEPSNSYRLSILAWNGAVTALPVAGQTVPFDVDVGTDARGRPWAVYIRCEQSPAFGVLLVVVRPGKRCSLYAYSFDSRTQRRLAGPTSTRSASLQSPALAGGRVFVARVTLRRRRARSSPLRVAVIPLSGGRLRRIAAPAIEASSIGRSDAIGHRYDVITFGSLDQVWQVTLGGKRTRLYSVLASHR